MNRCKLIFSMALSGMVLFSSALAQSYGDGTVLTGQDEPVKQARVEISHQDGADSQTVYTDDEGAFSFNNLYTGTSDGGRLEGITVAGSPGRMHTVVYPTPGDDDGVARLYGMNGRLVREIPVESQGGVTSASFGDDLSPGVYLYNDGKHTAKVVHTSNGPRGSQSMPSFKSSSERDMYTFTVTPQDGESNVLFDETSSDQNLESGYNTVDLTVVPTGFMHSVSGEGNVSGAELVFENEGEQIFQTTTDGDGTYQTGSDYLNNRTEDFNITITPPSDDYESLDTLITRNWNEGEGSTFNFNLDENNPDYYENEEVYHLIRRQDYPYEGGYTNIDYAKVIFDGVNIDYTDSISNSGSQMFLINGLHIPPNDQGEPGVALYERTVIPTDTTYYNMFQEKTDTVEITMDSYQLPDAEPLQYPQYVYFQGNVSDVLDPDQKISGASVIAYNPESGEEYAQATTDSQGNYTLDDYIPANTTFAFKVGWTSGEDSDYLSSVGHEYTTKDQIVWDTTSTVNWGMVPKEVELPATENDPNHGMMVTVDPEKVEDLIRGPPGAQGYVSDLEEALGRKVNFYIGDLSGDDKQTLKNRVREGDSVFYGISVATPLDAENRPFNIVNSTYNPDNQLPMPGDYHPVDNYHPGDLGWAIHYGGNETEGVNREVENGKIYNEYGRVGGDIWIDMTDAAGNLKELYGRSEDRQDVTGYDSFMNLNASYPTIQDRINIHIIHANEEQRWTFDENGNSNTYYPADKLEYDID